MAPKAKSKPSKAEQAKKAKAAEDLTFGLKNKNKSKKVQKYVQHVQKQAVSGNVKGGHTAEQQAAQKAKDDKKAKLQQAALMAALFKGQDNTKTTKIDTKPAQTGPTHEELKESQRIDLYTDQRGTSQNENTCKFFLEAAESSNYGWFWQCPNGRDCIYRHALPEGYILKKDRPKPGEEDEHEDIAEKVDEELKNIDRSTAGTPVTEETFKAWKKKITEEKEAALKKLVEEEKKKKKKKSEKTEETVEKSAVSGKDLFTFNPELFVDDASAMRVDAYKEDEAYLDEMRAEEEKLAADHMALQRKMLDEAEAVVDESMFVEEGDNLDDLDDLDLDE